MLQTGHCANHPLGEGDLARGAPGYLLSKTPKKFLEKAAKDATTAIPCNWDQGKGPIDAALMSARDRSDRH